MVCTSSFFLLQSRVPLSRYHHWIWDLDRHWSKSNLFYRSPSTLFDAHARFIDLLKMRAIMMRRPGCRSNVDVTNERPGCRYDMKVQWRGCWNWWLDIRIKFVDHVSRSCEWLYIEIIWVVTCQNHVINRSRDHNIRIVFLLRCKLYWVWKSSIKE